MTRLIVGVVNDDGGRRPDYDKPFDDEKYWDMADSDQFGLSEGEVSIIPE